MHEPCPATQSASFFDPLQAGGSSLNPRAWNTCRAEDCSDWIPRIPVPGSTSRYFQILPVFHLPTQLLAPHHGNKTRPAKWVRRVGNIFRVEEIDSERQHSISMYLSWCWLHIWPASAISVNWYSSCWNLLPTNRLRFGNDVANQNMSQGAIHFNQPNTLLRLKRRRSMDFHVYSKSLKIESKNILSQWYINVLSTRLEDTELYSLYQRLINIPQKGQKNIGLIRLWLGTWGWAEKCAPQFWWGNNFNHNRCPMQVACHRQIAKGLPCEWPVWTRATRIAKVSLHPFLWSPMDTLAHRVIVIHWAYAVGWPQAPSFWDPNSTRKARFSEGTGPFASHLANGVQNVQVLQ